MKRRRYLLVGLGALGLAGGTLSLAVATLWPVPGRPYDVTDVRAGIDHAPSTWIGRTIDVRGYGSTLQEPIDGVRGSSWAIMLQPLVGEEVAHHSLMARREPHLVVRLTRAQYAAVTQSDGNGSEVWNRTPAYPDDVCPSGRFASFVCGWVDTARMNAAETPFVFRVRVAPVSRASCSVVWMTCYDGELVGIPAAMRDTP